MGDLGVFFFRKPSHHAYEGGVGFDAVQRLGRRGASLREGAVTESR